MEITDIRIFPVDEEKLKAYVTITLDNCFVIRDLKVINGNTGLFIAMPAKRRKDGTYRDIAHPLNTTTRDRMEKTILLAYERQVKLARNAPASREAPATERHQRFPSDVSWFTEMGMPTGDFKVFSGNSNIPLARRICDYLRRPLSKAEVARFSDGEIQVEIGDNVRGQDTFIIQSTCPPVNDHLLE